MSAKKDPTWKPAVATQSFVGLSWLFGPTIIKRTLMIACPNGHRQLVTEEDAPKSASQPWYFECKKCSYRGVIILQDLCWHHPPLI